MREAGLQTPSEDIRILGIHLKQSIKARFHRKPQGYAQDLGYDEAAEQAKFSRECTHHHGPNTHNRPRNPEREQWSEISSSSLQPNKAAKVHFADEELAHAVTSSEPKPLPPKEQVEGLMRRWLDPEDEAEPGEVFLQACPVTHSYILDIIHGDGVNDWVTRAAALAELNNARLPMLEASNSSIVVMYDLQALQVLYCIVEGMEVYGLPP